jgi:hypothetical protein
MAVVLCHMGETILVKVPILAVSLIDLGLEGREQTALLTLGWSLGGEYDRHCQSRCHRTRQWSLHP